MVGRNIDNYSENFDKFRKMWDSDRKFDNTQFSMCTMWTIVTNDYK